MTDLCSKAVFDYMCQNIKCGIDGRIVDSRCQKCIQYEHTDNGIKVVNRSKETLKHRVHTERPERPNIRIAPPSAHLPVRGPG